MAKIEYLMKRTIFLRLPEIYDQFPSGMGEIPAGVKDIEGVKKSACQGSTLTVGLRPKKDKK